SNNATGLGFLSFCPSAGRLRITAASDSTHATVRRMGFSVVKVWKGGLPVEYTDCGPGKTVAIRAPLRRRFCRLFTTGVVGQKWLFCCKRRFAACLVPVSAG